MIVKQGRSDLGSEQVRVNMVGLDGQYILGVLICEY